MEQSALQDKQENKQMPWFLVFADFCRVNIPTVAEFKLLTGQWSWEACVLESWDQLGPEHPWASFCIWGWSIWKSTCTTGVLLLLVMGQRAPGRSHGQLSCTACHCKCLFQGETPLMCWLAGPFTLDPSGTDGTDCW